MKNTELLRRIDCYRESIITRRKGIDRFLIVALEALRSEVEKSSWTLASQQHISSFKVMCDMFGLSLTVFNDLEKAHCESIQEGDKVQIIYDGSFATVSKVIKATRRPSVFVITDSGQKLRRQTAHTCKVEQSS